MKEMKLFIVLHGLHLAHLRVRVMASYKMHLKTDDEAFSYLSFRACSHCNGNGIFFIIFFVVIEWVLDPIVTAMAIENFFYHSNEWWCSHCDGNGKPKILNLFVVTVAA